MIHLCANIRILRLARTRSQADVAALLGVTRSTYSGWENSGIEPPLKHVVVLGQHYRLSLDILITTDLSTLRPSQIEELQRAY